VKRSHSQTEVNELWRQSSVLSCISLGFQVENIAVSIHEMKEAGLVIGRDGSPGESACCDFEYDIDVQ
jgi:hypothetical protein